MSSNLLWLTVLGSYIVQTKSFSKILGRPTYNNNNNNNNIGNINNIHNATDDSKDNTIKPIKNLSVQIAIVYFAAWFLLIPLSRFWNLPHKSSSTENEDVEVSNLNLDRDDTAQESKFSVLCSKLKHFSKIFTLSLFISIAVLSYTLALTMTPAFDVTLIQNTSIFEITTLLYGVCGVSKRQNVFRNFIFMMMALIGILIVSYTNATCDLLAGKLSINKETGEVNDPFLFDRLKAALLCGLGSLTIGPFAVLSNKWLTNEKPSMNRRNVSYIALTSICLLIPFIPKKSSFWMDMNSNNESGWLFLMIAIVGGILPNIISIILLNKNSPPEFVTTANLAVIVLMGIVQGLSESNETYIVRWEVIGYIMLTCSAIFLFISLRGKK
ncbi:mannosyl phosphorylinositol ceramide synthase regulatory protein Csg2p [Monosporozyma unispora]|nr:hypothetical protein C6P44_004504 [Kazachstania unispora]